MNSIMLLKEHIATYWLNDDISKLDILTHCIDIYLLGVLQGKQQDVEWFIVWALSKIKTACSFISWSGDSKMATVFIPPIRNCYTTKGLKSLWNTWRNFEKGIWDIVKWADFEEDLQKYVEIWLHFYSTWFCERH